MKPSISVSSGAWWPRYCRTASRRTIAAASPEEPFGPGLQAHDPGERVEMPIDSLLVMRFWLVPYIRAESCKGRRGLAEFHAALRGVVPAFLDQRVVRAVPIAQSRANPLEEGSGATEGPVQVVHVGKREAQVLGCGIVRRPR